VKSSKPVLPLLKKLLQSLHLQDAAVVKKGRKAATAKAVAKVAVKKNNIVLLVSERISLSMRMRSVFFIW
jgi:hypothetical protein